MSASGGPVIRIGTRGSLLATTQAGTIRDALIARGHAAELVIISTEGDRSDRPVAEIGVGVFTAALREAIADGRVVPVVIDTITESETFERQNLVSKHLIWTEGPHVSHSWHPERFSNLPRRYIRQSEGGEFTFQLLR